MIQLHGYLKKLIILSILFAEIQHKNYILQKTN